MSWQDEMVPLLRALIGDMDSPTVYSDSRLEEVIVAGAQLLQSTVDFDNIYTIIISSTSISPDPTDSPRDDAFINLTSLRAAMFILDNEAKLAAKLGIRVTDGPSSVDTSGRLSGALALAKEMRENFRIAKVEFMAGNSRAGESVLTPYTNVSLAVTQFGENAYVNQVPFSQDSFYG